MAPDEEGTEFAGASIDGGGLTAEDQSDLKKQLSRVKALMSDGEWRTFKEIVEVVGGTEAAISARLRDLRKEKFGSHTVSKRLIGKRLYQYRVGPLS